MTSKELITELYIGYFDRAPDPAGLAFWIAVLDGGALTLEEIAQDFASQPETLATYPILNNDPAANTVADVESFIEAIYENLFDRAPEPAGLTFWTGVLQDGFPVGTFILAIIDGASAADRAVLDNKVEVGCAWVEAAQEDEGFVLNDAYINGSADALGDVSADSASVDAGKDAADLFFQEAPSVALSGTTTTLAEDIDLTNRLKVADIAITDDGLGSNDLVLAGDDAGFFEIDGTELFLKAGVALDFETNAALDVTVEVDDAGVGTTPDDTADLTITLTDANDAPNVALENTVTDISEAADTSAAVKVADIVVLDDALGTATLGLTGVDAELFEISGSELHLKAGSVLDFETNPALDVSVTVEDATVGGDPDATAPLSIAITDVNEAPTVSFVNAISALAEDTDTAAAVKIADIGISDDALGINDLSLSGADAALFEIVGSELFLKAGIALDFETDPTLNVNVLVDDTTVGASPDDDDMLSLSITNVNESPNVLLSGTVTDLPEDTDTSAAVKVADIVVTDDGQGSNTLALVGADAAFFEIVGTELLLKAGTALNFESTPAFEVAVTIDDPTLGGSPDATAPLTVAIIDVNEAPAVALSGTLTTLLETDDTSARVKVADILLSDDGQGTNVLGLTGTDAGLFEIDGMELFLTAGTVLDADANSSLDVVVTVDDASLGGSPDGSAALSIVVADVNGVPEVALDNASSTLAEDLDTSSRVKVADIVITDDAAGSNTLALTGADAGLFEILGTELFLQAGTALDFETDGSLDVSVTVDDPTLGVGVEDTTSITIAITDVNEAPTVSLTATTVALPEDTGTSLPIKVAEIVITDDALGTNALGLAGADAALFEILGTDLFLSAGAGLDFETDALLNVSVTVDDVDVGASPDAAAAFALTITNVNEAPSLSLIEPETELFEGTNTTNRVLMGTIALSDDGTGTNTLGLTGADASLFEIVGNGLFLKAGTVLDAVANPSLDVTVTVDDAAVAGSPDDTVSLSATINPGSPGAAVENTNTLTLIGNAANTVRFGQIEVVDADPITPGNQPGFVFNTNPDGDPYAGVAGSTLSVIDVTDHDGLVSLGVIADIDGAGAIADTEGFLLDNSGSVGDVEACLGEGDVFGTLIAPELDASGEWNFDNTGATGTMVISIKEIVLNAGGTLTFLNVDIVIAGDIDLTVLGDDLTIDTDSTIEVAAGGRLTLTVEQVDDLEDLGVVIFGEGSVVVTGESGEDGTVATDDIDTDFGNLQTASVDLSAVTLATADTNGAIGITVSGAASDDAGTDLVVGGVRIAQTVIGTANNDAVMVASSAADADPGTLDVILELGADSGDIGDPIDTPVGTVDPAEMVGDTIDLDSAILTKVQINADAGFDAVIGTGFSSRIDVQIASGAEFYAPLAVGDYLAGTVSSNEGTAVLEAVGLTDRDIDVSAAGGTAGWTLIGAEGSTETILIGGGQDDLLVDGINNDDNNNNEEDIFTGNGGLNLFQFNVAQSDPVTLDDETVNNAAIDIEYLEIVADEGSDPAGGRITIAYELNDQTAFADISDADLTSLGIAVVDFDDVADIARAIRESFDTVAGLTVDGTGPEIELVADDGGMINITSITYTGLATVDIEHSDDGASALMDVDLESSGLGDGYADDEFQNNTLTFAGAPEAGEVYSVTVTLANGDVLLASVVAADTVLATLMTDLTAELNAVSAAYVDGVQFIATAGATTIDIEETTDAQADNGGFTVTLTSTPTISAVSSSSLLPSAPVGTETLEDQDVDLITDFISSDDVIDYVALDGSGVDQLGAGDSDNYGEAANEATFGDALIAANIAFAGDADLVYYLTGSDDATDNDAAVGEAGPLGLLFVNANGDGEADAVVVMTGVSAASFGDSNIV